MAVIVTKVLGVLSPYYQPNSKHNHMTKNVSLTIGERVAAISLLNEGKFNNATLAVVLDDIKKIAVTPEDWAGANLVKTPTDEQVSLMTQEERAATNQTWKWNDDAAMKEVELGQETIDFLHNEIKRKGDALELSISDGAVLTLDKKLTA